MSEKAKTNQWLKLGLELGPLVLFFLANSQGRRLIEAVPMFAWFREPIFLATAVFMVAITISLIASRILVGRLPIMPLVTGFVVLVFGSLTLLLHDELFIKLKPTIINTLFGVVLLGGLYFGRSLLSYVFDDAFHLTETGWKKLTFRWGIFFLFLAVVNEVVWRTQTTDFWVAFKVWGTMPMTFAFMMFQMPLLTAHGEDPAPEDPTQTPGETGE
jgi:intracellular septation protein